MSTKWHRVAGIVWGTFLVTLSAAPLPQNFYSILNKKAISDISGVKPEPIIYIVVPDFSVEPTTDHSRLAQLDAFMSDTTVPQDFFARGLPKEDTQPVKLFFDWREKENSKTRKQAGHQLANGIKDLNRQFKNAKFILVGHGQGGNVINVASNHVSVPLHVVIHLSTPIFPHTSNPQKDPYADYLPSSMIEKLFCFYTEQAFSSLHPSLGPSYLHKYPERLHPNTVNGLLVINNKLPLPQETLRPLVGEKLLPLCKKMTSRYRVHHDLIAHLSNIKPSTDMVVAINPRHHLKEQDERTTSEQKLSCACIEKFTKDWGRPLTLTLAKGEKSRSLHKSIELLTTQKKG